MSEITPTQKRAKKYFGTYLTTIALFVTFGLGLLVGQVFFLKKDVVGAQGVQTIFLGSTASSSSVDLSQFWTVWNMIKSRYVHQDKVNDKDMYNGAIEGVVASLGDPYSEYFPPKEAESFTKDLSGELEGIGAEIAVKNNQLVVVTPLPGTPAFKAGLTPGDKILFIDKTSTIGMDVNTAVSKIRGAANTIVALTIDHNGKVRDIPIVRAKINVPSVTYSLKPGNIADITLTQFNDTTMADLDKYITKFQDQKIKGVILDLRNNPGGYLETAVDVASEWITDGTIVSEKDVTGATNVHEARGEHLLSNYKTIVLVNGGSASAAEIVAGALQDRGKATIMGEQTFGKGSVQDVQSFADGSALKLTIAEWYTPTGKNINKAGITPDVVFKQDYSKEKIGQDSMLSKALTMFAKKK